MEFKHQNHKTIGISWDLVGFFLHQLVILGIKNRKNIGKYWDMNGI